MSDQEHAATALREQAERIAEFESQCESLADECKGLEAQIAAVSEAIGGSEYMDPPDGGDVSLAEQVGRMRAENVRLRQWQREMVEKAADKSLDGYRELASKCAALEAENDRLRSELAAAREALERVAIHSVNHRLLQTDTEILVGRLLQRCIDIASQALARHQQEPTK